MRVRVFIRQPRNVMISFNPPSANILRMDAGPGRFIGSSRPARGLKMRKRAMTTACAAHATMPMLLGESRTAQAPPSM